MKVFLSWSKPRSRQVAEALRDWLPLVLQRVEPWMSAADLEAGVRWGQLLSEQLETTAFGIICVTQENQHEPWLHFEAGAVSKKVSHPRSRVIPLGFGIDRSAMPGPLQQFQAVNADEAGVKSIVRSMHACLTEKLPDERSLNRTVEKWLPELFDAWSKIKPLDEQPPEPQFNSNDALKEMLLMMRQLSREIVDEATLMKIFRVEMSQDLERSFFGNLKNKLRPLGLLHFGLINDSTLDVAVKDINTELMMTKLLNEHGVPSKSVRLT